MATIVGIPRESLAGEKRVAASPDSVKKLKEKGFTIRVEKGAGVRANFPDELLASAGAELVDDAFKDADVVLKVRPPSLDECAKLKAGALLVSLVQAHLNPDVPGAVAKAKASLLALEKIPRVTRAQKMDVLSSQANLSGYRAVIEAAEEMQGFFGPQVTAAGATPPAKVLIIGAGVAGLAALGAARALGADVRAFDTRAAAREQVESLGGKFLEVTIKETGEGGGGYAKVMSPEFIAAEMALFREQAKEVDVIITTALVPGTKAPTLVPKDVVECLKPGSIVVDMAAEQGGNCELCKPGEIALHNGVKIVGYTDLASRMASTSSKFFAMNLFHLMGEISKDGALVVNLENDVVRPALLVHNGEVLPPPPVKEPSPAPAKKPVEVQKTNGAVAIPVKTSPAASAPAKPQEAAKKPAGSNANATIFGLAAVAGLMWASRYLPSEFLQHLTVFVLACFVGWQVVWAVTPALHTPLMSVTNAISGIIVIGGMLQVGTELSPAAILGVVAVLVATINIAGGFLVTQRMLRMFKREDAAPARGGHS